MDMTTKTAFALMASAFFIAEVAAFDTSRITDPQVRACAERALPSATASQLQKVDVVDANGRVRQSSRQVYWRRTPDNDSRVLVRVLEPREDRGIAVLINDDAARNVVSYMTYSPKLKRVRRVTGASFFGSILGTDFTYEDFSYFYRVDEREEVERVDDAELDGHAMYVLETIKEDDESHYKLARFFIDQNVCLPMKTEFIAPNGDLRKALIVDRESLEQRDERWIPLRSTMYDYKHGTHTVFVGEEVEIDPELREGLFEVSELRRGN